MLAYTLLSPLEAVHRFCGVNTVFHLFLNYYSFLCSNVSHTTDTISELRDLNPGLIQHFTYFRHGSNFILKTYNVFFN